MDCTRPLLIIVLALATYTVYVSSQGTCQNNFVTSLYQCLGNRSLDRDNFLWLARDGKLGKEPSDLQSFTSRVCIEKQGLYMCVRTALDNSLALPEAQCPQTQKTSLITLFKDIFKTLNKKCEDPCRQTYRDSLTKCFTDKNFLNSDYLLLNVTAKRDAIMGTNKTEIERFCTERESIIQCMKTASIQCNDSPFLLRSYSLDINALAVAYTVLCNTTQVYLESTECFRTPTVATIQCRNTLANKVGLLESQLADLNVTDGQYRDELCRLRVDQMQCEMNAMAKQNDTAKCNNVVMGIHRQQECILLPAECRPKNQSPLNLLCQLSDFLLPERMAYKSPANKATGALGLMFLSFFHFFHVVHTPVNWIVVFLCYSLELGYRELHGKTKSVRFVKIRYNRVTLNCI